MRNSSTSRTVSAAVLTACAFISLAAVVRAEPIDRVAAAVNNDVVTLSELRQAVAFNAALGGKGDDKRVEAETLQGIVNRRLLLQEAHRLKMVEVTEQDVAAELGRLRQRSGDDAAFRRFLAQTGMTEQQLMLLLAERLLVERFVERKIGMFARVGRDEAQAYFNDHPDEFKGRRFPEAQKQITAYLAAQKVNQQLDQYVEELRGRAFIRMNDYREEGKAEERSKK